MGNSKTKIIVAILLTVAYYVIFFFCKFTLFKLVMLSPSNYRLSESCLIVHGQVTTGPEIRVVEGSEFLVNAIPSPHPGNLNVSELEMTGKRIESSFLDYPDYYACDWLIYGKVTGTTDMYEICGSGTIPIFECDELYPIMSLSQFLSLEIIMFSKFPIGLFGAIAVYLLPFIVMGIYAFAKKVWKAGANKERW